MFFCNPDFHLLLFNNYNTIIQCYFLPPPWHSPQWSQCAGRSSLWLSSFSFYFPPWSRSSLSQSFSINSHTLLSWRKSVFWLTDSVWVLPCKLLIRSFFTFSLTLTHHNCHLLVTIKAYWKVPLGSTLKGNHIIIQHILHYCIRVWTSITWTWKDQPLRPERPSLLVTQKSFLQLRH